MSCKKATGTKRKQQAQRRTDLKEEPTSMEKRMLISLEGKEYGQRGEVRRTVISLEAR
jgi:hypothetical protein